MNAIVHMDKITKYLLNSAHKTGAPKAKFFIAKGFSPERPEELAEALKRHPIEARLTGTEPDPEGRKLTYQCDITIPDGTTTCVRSIWMEAEDGSYTRLISAYPFH